VSVSLYRKYRSRSLDEIVGQDAVVKALKATLASDSIGHAYLFTGPRGVGKTSIARILAFEINKLAYDASGLPVDIIEIDAASNRGIEEIRDLREKVKIAPVSSKYKVYIIDEVHMLTTPAFNALLKTLEEPPAHVVFILATTESHKLPETIVSRTQNYNFRLASVNEVVKHLKSIAKQEDIKITNDALELIAIHTGGSMRDALSTLDHVRHLSSNVSEEDVRINIGLPSSELTTSLLEAIGNNSATDVVNIIQESEQHNVSALSIANNLLQLMRSSLQGNQLQMSLDQAAKLMTALSEVESSNKPETKLLIALLGAITANGPIAQSAPQKSTLAVEPKPFKAPPKPPEPTEQKANPPPEQPAKEITPKPPQQAQGPFNHEIWVEILEDIRSSHNTLYSVLRMAEVDISQVANSVIALNFEFPFHQKRINESKNKKVLQQKLNNKGFSGFEINCGITSKKQPKATGKEPAINETNELLSAKEDVLSQIRGVFDGAEVME
jgi:DNA polymerase III subunit gamma/tau